MSALGTAVDVLRCFSEARPELSFAEVMAATGLPKSSTSRMLRALKEAQLLEQDEVTRRYRPGLLTFELGRLYRAHDDLIGRAEKELKEVCARTGHTGYIAMLDGCDQMVLRMVPGSNPLRVMSPPGQRGSAIATSNGRAMLARLSDAEILSRLPDTFPTLPPNSPHSPTELLARVGEIRRSGQSLSENESIDGVASQGFALCARETGEMIGVAVSYSSQATAQEERDHVARELEAMARTVGRMIGDAVWGRALEVA
ncbi:transcriptional regulator [Azorhizobium oxalatiphilum]|uniref:Transcriptional regulator n=1 Tax=Azorhizobium oxalatiphilum TaxID=980631 RepID=A0A917FE72_9HYPH|nr:IclR family transcriptional regulator [Azorhizobium oxalatiphilum]GGF70834.1 transcriptional regulator [Azorhizobium oxalatiphilum]